jgi:hypothetical protein
VIQELPTKPSTESGLQRFERILSQGPLEGLKAIIDRVSSDRDRRYAAVSVANTYEELLARLGYRVILTKVIHVQDAYSRLVPEGGIKAVLPYHDIPTQSSLPTLVNVDSTVTMTPKGVTFFTALFSELKKQLSAKT